MCYIMKTEALLQIAEWAVTLTRKMVPYSSNLATEGAPKLKRSIMLGLVRSSGKNPEDKALAKEIRSWNLDISPNKESDALDNSLLWVESLNKFLTLKEINALLNKRQWWESNPNDPMTFIEKSSMRALKTGIGNCGELSGYTMFLLNEYPLKGIPELNLPPITEKILIERVLLDEKEDHCFIVINRDLSKSLSDIKSWNDDAIIVDAWTKECYTKKQLFENKTPEEIDYIINILKELKITIPSDCFKFHIGDNVHSKDWQQRKSRLEQQNITKFWRPTKLMDATSRPSVTEQLPKTKSRSYRTLLIANNNGTIPPQEIYTAAGDKAMTKFQLEQIKDFYFNNPSLLKLSENDSKPKIFTRMGFRFLDNLGFKFFDRIDGEPLIGKGRVIAISDGKLWILLDNAKNLLALDTNGPELKLGHVKLIREDYHIKDDILALYKSQDENLVETTQTVKH